MRAPERPESRPPLPLGERPGVGGLPRLRALAQLARMYLLAEGPEGDLYLIDQHAAHERITYERLMEQRGRGAIESQRLLIPQPVVVGPSAQGVLLEAVEQLAGWGFEIEEAGQALRVRAVPASVAPDEIKAALLEVADHLSGAGGSTPEAWREAMLVTLSCHTSVRTGQPLTSAEQQALIDQLARCWGPRTCPHGRPTVIVMTKQQLTRQFGRLA
jgi:DNA mismatch repair protein MutL